MNQFYQQLDSARELIKEVYAASITGRNAAEMALIAGRKEHGSGEHEVSMAVISARQACEDATVGARKIEELETKALQQLALLRENKRLSNVEYSEANVVASEMMEEARRFKDSTERYVQLAEEEERKVKQAARDYEQRLLNAQTHLAATERGENDDENTNKNMNRENTNKNMNVNVDVREEMSRCLNQLTLLTTECIIQAMESKNQANLSWEEARNNEQDNWRVCSNRITTILSSITRSEVQAQVLVSATKENIQSAAVLQKLSREEIELFDKRANNLLSSIGDSKMAAVDAEQSCVAAQKRPTSANVQLHSPKINSKKNNNNNKNIVISAFDGIGNHLFTGLAILFVAHYLYF